MSGVRHLVRHLRCWWLQRTAGMPRWENDRVASMLGVAHFGCPSCGYGSIKERDR